MKDAHDLPKIVPLFAIIYSIYLFGQLLVGVVTHRQKLKKIRAEKIEKCPKCTEAQSCDDAIQSETARVAARDANSRAESLTLELGNSVQRAAEAERRAFEAERRLSGWNFKFPATVLEPLSDPRLLIFIERTACIPNIPAAWDNFFASLPPWTRKKS